MNHNRLWNITQPKNPIARSRTLLALRFCSIGYTPFTLTGKIILVVQRFSFWALGHTWTRKNSKPEDCLCEAADFQKSAARCIRRFLPIVLLTLKGFNNYCPGYVNKNINNTSNIIPAVKLQPNKPIHFFEADLSFFS